MMKAIISIFVIPVALSLGSLPAFAQDPPDKASTCNGLLQPNDFQILVDHKVFISQFTAGVKREKSDAICTPVAAANAAQALYYSLTGKAVYPQLLIDFVNEAWEAFAQFPDVHRNQGLPFTYHPALALGAANQLKMLDRVVPVGYSDPKWLAQHPQEVVSTKSRIRILGIKTETSAHSVLSLGMDFQTKELLILDPNDASKIQRLKIVARDGRLLLAQNEIGQNIKMLHSGLGAKSFEYEIISVFGLDVKAEMPSANDSTFDPSK